MKNKYNIKELEAKLERWKNIKLEDINPDEVDEIMNNCYDNALIDEENRVGYAFMLKHNIITAGYETEPNKEINWESCRILVDVLYNSSEK